MSEFLTGNDWKWRLARTVCQGLVGVLIANIDLLVGCVVLDTAMRPVVVAAVMAVLSPVMAELGAAGGSGGGAGAGGGTGGGDAADGGTRSPDGAIRGKHAAA